MTAKEVERVNQVLRQLKIFQTVWASKSAKVAEYV